MLVQGSDISNARWPSGADMGEVGLGGGSRIAVGTT